MLEFHNNILCVHGGWLYREAEIVSKPHYDVLKRRGFLNVVRNGGNGRTALVEFETMRSDIKEAVIAILGDPYKKVKRSNFEERIQVDGEAEQYFSTFTVKDGRNLPDDKQLEYRTNAEILNALHEIVKSRTAKRRALGGSNAKIWDQLASMVTALNSDRYPHTLPSNPRRLKAKYNEYMEDGYLSLVHKGYCNDNSRKVTAALERLIMSLYVMPEKPYSSDIHDMYLQFLGKALEVVDYKTGELFDPEEFRDSKGKALQVSETTVWNYLNMPHNRIIVDKFRAGTLEYSSTHRPHHHRHAPQWSLSKISMDDRDLPRKMEDGKRVKAYYAYDVTSGCIIGASYSKKKDSNLFVECMRNMFRFLDQEGLGTPLQVEVEHHLVASFKDGLMKAENVFRFVRWSNPGNAQEKYAETGHRLKKYGYEKKYQQGIGRFYSKLEANRTHTDKIFDEDNDNYKESFYSFERLVADDREIIELYNNDLHPNQKRFPGKTRMDVLVDQANPEVKPLEPYKLALYIGDSTETSILRNQYVSVRSVKYQLPSVDVLKRLSYNNRTVTAYYVPEPNGMVNCVHLFQDGIYLCECALVETYNTANSEWNDVDQVAYTNQAKYVSEFDAEVKARKKELAKIQIHRIKKPMEDTPEVVIVQEEKEIPEDFQFNDNYDARSFRDRAKDSL